MHDAVLKIWHEGHTQSFKRLKNTFYSKIKSSWAVDQVLWVVYAPLLGE